MSNIIVCAINHYMKQTKLTKSARGQECQVRIPNVCNRNDETVVLAHLNGAGWSRKQSDIHGAYCCSSCHDAIDGRRKTDYLPEELKLMHLDGVVRTQTMMLDQGLIKL